MGLRSWSKNLINTLKVYLFIYLPTYLSIYMSIYYSVGLIATQIKWVGMKKGRCQVLNIELE